MKDEPKYPNIALDSGHGLPFTGWQLARARCWSLMDCTGLSKCHQTRSPLKLPKFVYETKDWQIAPEIRVRNRPNVKSTEYFTYSWFIKRLFFLNYFIEAIASNCFFNENVNWFLGQIIIRTKAKQGINK